MLAYCTTARAVLRLDAEGLLRHDPDLARGGRRIDGLTPFGTFWRIVIPLSLPGSPSRSSTRSSPPGTRSRSRTSSSSRTSVHAAGRAADLRLPVRSGLGEDDRRRGARHAPGRARLPRSRSAISSRASRAAASRARRRRPSRQCGRWDNDPPTTLRSAVSPSAGILPGADPGPPPRSCLGTQRAPLPPSLPGDAKKTLSITRL